MKLLIRDDVNNLSWKDAIYKNGKFHPLNGERPYYNSSIYGVKDDNRNKMVRCSACGQEISNTPAAIRSHRNMVHKSNKCFNCNYLKHGSETVLSQKYVLNDDGTYLESTKRNVRLLCGYSWKNWNINSDKAKQVCRYAACENATFNRIEDFWTKYPDAFNEFITIDRIIDIGYKDMHKYAPYITFSLKGKARLEAYVNNQGICYEFKLYYRRDSYVLRYSKKYDTVWVVRNSGFVKLETYDISDDIKESVAKRIRALYA